MEATEFHRGEKVVIISGELHGIVCIGMRRRGWGLGVGGEVWSYIVMVWMASVRYNLFFFSLLNDKQMLQLITLNFVFNNPPPPVEQSDEHTLKVRPEDQRILDESITVAHDEVAKYFEGGGWLTAPEDLISSWSYEVSCSTQNESCRVMSVIIIHLTFT